MTNVYMFNNYSNGLSMRSSHAPLIADILLMGKFKKELFSSRSSLLQNIKYSYRYVNDVVCPNQLQNSLQLLNSFYATINFTLEIDGSQINFLDPKIIVRESQL